MTWHATAPDGNLSVKDNESILQDNTTYIETKLGNQVVGTNTTPQTALDHFWNVGANEDGRHRFIQAPAFVDSTPQVSAIPVRAAGMDSVLYAKTTNSTVQWFHKNEDVNTNIYQVTPTQLKGTIAITSTSSYTTIIAVPANVYGEIFMWQDANGNDTGQTGFFKSSATKVDAWSLWLFPQGEQTKCALKFGNGIEADLLNIRARRDFASSATWNYRITYREI